MMTSIQGSASGIAGEVILWPVSPVEWPGMINHRPWQAAIRITDEAGRTVAQVQSDAGGRFEVMLEPGVYRLHPESDVACPRAPEQTVTVQQDGFTPVRITYDSGMR
jgi:hypothetical protein